MDVGVGELCRRIADKGPEMKVAPDFVAQGL
ncbi:Uncharacterised protein [Mycobacteroides abscessus subsp. abscessus]|nr:Uncharacterised protein [Mycobacteroides abscessus subsp. abscessus]